MLSNSDTGKIGRALSPLGHKYCWSASIGYSLVPCDTLRPVTNPWPYVNMKRITVGGARADKFFEYPQFEEVLKAGHNLVVMIMLGGSDISEATDVSLKRSLRLATTW